MISSKHISVGVTGRSPSSLIFWKSKQIPILYACGIWARRYSRNSLFLFLTGCLSYQKLMPGITASSIFRIFLFRINLAFWSKYMIGSFLQVLYSGIFSLVPYSYRPAQQAVVLVFPWKQVGLYNDGCPLHQEANELHRLYGLGIIEDAGWNLNVIIQKATVPRVVLRNTVAFCIL